MDKLPIFLSAFVAVFFAELGDKTQLAALTLASSSAQKWQVFLGASAALVLSTLIAVAFADVIAKFVSPVVLKRLAGAIFLILGFLTLRESFGS